MKKLIALLLISFTSLNSFSQDDLAKEGDKILGLWLSGTGKGKIKITKYGEKYGGKIVWLSEPNNAS